MKGAYYKMKEKAQEITNRILADLKEQDYADYTVGLYQQCYNGLQKYMSFPQS